MGPGAAGGRGSVSSNTSSLMSASELTAAGLGRLEGTHAQGGVINNINNINGINHCINNSSMGLGLGPAIEYKEETDSLLSNNVKVNVPHPTLQRSISIGGSMESRRQTLAEMISQIRKYDPYPCIFGIPGTFVSRWLVVG